MEWLSCEGETGIVTQPFVKTSPVDEEFEIFLVVGTNQCLAGTVS